MKRSRGDTLTGGTGDVNPQWFNMSVTMTAANTYTEEAFQIPIQRLQGKKNSSMVMEALRIEFYGGVKDNNAVAGGESSQMNIQVTTRSLPNANNPVNSAVIASYQKEYRGAFTAGGTYQSVFAEPFVVDLTDGSGHGTLIATDQVFIGTSSSAFAAASIGEARILYRWKEVSIMEYVGIVQSQQ